MTTDKERGLYHDDSEILKKMFGCTAGLESGPSRRDRLAQMGKQNGGSEEPFLGVLKNSCLGRNRSSLAAH